MGIEDHYQLLGVNRRASQDDLKSAFRSRVLSVHPDHNPGDDAAPERTRVLVEAYKVLSNPGSRRRYDLALAASAQPPPVAFGPIETPPTAHWAVRAVVVMVMVIILLAALAAACEVALSSRTPVYRPLLVEMPGAPEPEDVPMPIRPGLSHCVEWYQTQQYQLGLASEWVARETLRVYADAATRAARRGDPLSARFYETAARDIQESRSALHL